MADAQMAFDPSLKKKKKKKDALKLAEEALAEVVPEAAPAEAVAPSDQGAGAAPEAFDPTMKKKSKSVRIAEAPAPTPVVQSSIPPEADENEPDFTYAELLTRVMDIVKAKNPERFSDQKVTFSMKPPIVQRAGAKKTSFNNIHEICRLMKRTPKHLVQFILAELGTEGSVDGNEAFIIKGRFHQKQIENVLRKYIVEYVMCHTCKSPETELLKEDRLVMLQCNKCESKCSVTTIKSGFHAQVGRRAAQRARNV